MVKDDGATLLKLLDIVHPAARTLVDIARAQDAEVGDGTTSVTLLAAEILKEVRPYIEEGVGVHTIIKGLREGRNMAMKKLAEIAVTIDKSDPECVTAPSPESLDADNCVQEIPGTALAMCMHVHVVQVDLLAEAVLLADGC